MTDPYDLERFLAAQAGTYETALTELKRGSKRTHWMWYVFPQFEGLGRSTTSKKFAIRSREEADAYWKHPVLGARLRDCVDAVLAHQGQSARAILGTPDDLKLCSSVTLFGEVTGDDRFNKVLEQFYGGAKDERTLRLMDQAPAGQPTRES